jgi:twitching motility protein PilU
MATMGTMERILRLMGEKKASDVYLSAHAPALIKINGQCLPINNQLLPPDAPRNLLAEVLPADRITELEETGELNMGMRSTGWATSASAPCASVAPTRP